MKRHRPQQLTLPFPGRGGFRKKAGRLELHDACLRHRRRPALSARHPVHVTVRLRRGLPYLRSNKTYALLRRVFEAGRDRFGFRLVHYSVQLGHIHLIVEAEDRVALSRGMKGLLVRVARAINKLGGTAGQVFPKRYHEHVLRTPREVRHALCYVLHNAKKHRMRLDEGLDPFTSIPWLETDAWKEDVTIRGTEDWASPVVIARTWLLTTGWRRHGLLSIEEVPGPSRGSPA